MLIFRMDLSVIIERETVQVKNGLEDAEKSTDSGVASTSGNSSNADSSSDSTKGKDVMNNVPLIIEFEALNARDSVPKESTFVAKSKVDNGNCDISAINGEGKNRSTLHSDGKKN